MVPSRNALSAGALGRRPVDRLFGEKRIARAVEQLAAEISAAQVGDLTIVGLLKGSFVFVADLVRALDRFGLAPRVEFIKLSSYGRGTESSGEVRLAGEVSLDVAGRQVLLVDDVIDTGRSLARARTLLTERGAQRLWTCVLIDKPARRVVDVPLDFVGFRAADVFVVGYGIDHAEKYRHLRFIGALRPDYRSRPGAPPAPRGG